jgi:hypothetical protein
LKTENNNNNNNNNNKQKKKTRQKKKKKKRSGRPSEYTCVTGSEQKIYCYEGSQAFSARFW